MRFRLAWGRRVGGGFRCCIGLTAVAAICVSLAAIAPAAWAETWVVNTTGDPNFSDCNVQGEECSLRGAIEAADSYTGPEEAVVDATQVSGTIELSIGPLELDSTGAFSIEVEGPGAGSLTVEAAPSTSVLEVNEASGAKPANLSISGMTIAGGELTVGDDGGGAGLSYSKSSSAANAPLTLRDVDFVDNKTDFQDGAAIEQGSEGSLTLIDCSFEENEANEDSHLGGDGGAIWSQGKLTLEDTQVGTVTQPNLSGGEGGGIYMAAGGSLALDERSSVAGNKASGNGGGIYLEFGTNLTVTGGAVTDNSSEGVGGGIYSDGGEVTIREGASVDDNGAETGGGGIYMATGNITVEHDSSVNTNQTAAGEGGGIYAAGAAMRVSDSEVSQNRAQGAGAAGGGIFAGPGEALTLVQATVDGNVSAVDGGGIFSEGVGSTVIESTVSGNLAEGEGGGSGTPTGGGLNVSSGFFILSVSTVAGNVIEGAGSQGGGVGFEGQSSPQATIFNSTIAQNSATATAGGLLAASTTEVTSTILGENSSSSCRDASGAGLASGGNNIVTSDCGFPAASSDQIGVDPELGELRDNGGPTETLAPTQAGSPVINRGANPGGDQSDQRLEPRPVPFGNQNTDVGAYEVQAPTNTAPPTIAGSPVVGQSVTCGQGSWDTDHVTANYTYTWTADGTPVGTGASHTVALSDEGDQLVCQVTADNGAMSVTAPSAPLTVPAARLAVSPAGVDFGTQQSGTESTPLTITVSNPGGNPLSLGQVVLAGTGAGGFSLSDGCSGTVVAAGGACQVGIRFAPTTDGTYAATLEVPTAVGTAGVELGGIGRTPTAAVSVTPAALNFGLQQTGTVGAPAAITISNSGDAPLNVGQLALEGAGADAYGLLADGCSGTTVEPGHHCVADVRFAPTSDGSFAAALLVPSSAEDERVELGGIGRTPTGAIEVTPASIAFGAQQVDTTSAPQEVKVTNSGDAPLTLGELGLGGPDAGHFSLAGGCSGATLAAGEGCAVAVTFNPTAVGELSAAVVIPSSVGQETVPLAGVGQIPASPPDDIGSSGGAGGAAGTGTGSTPSAGESADLRIHLGAPRRTIAGQRLIAELTIVNRGLDTARGIEVTATFDGVESGAVDADGPRCRGRRKIECAIAGLAPGRRVKLKITATPGSPGALKIVAAAHGATADGSATSDRDRRTVNVTPRRRQ